MNNNRLSESIKSLYSLILKLRGPGGCPWDARQNNSTVKMYLLEEAYEVLDAIENGTPDDICQELGDLLFQILFISILAEEKDEFNFVDVIEKIIQKMKNRHPHVFGDLKVSNTDEVVQNWHKIKQKEKIKNGNHLSYLENEPKNLPALLQAHRLTKKLSNGESNNLGNENFMTNLEDEFKTLKTSIEKNDQDSLKKSISELLFNLAALSENHKLNAEEILRGKNQSILKSIL